MVPETGNTMGVLNFTWKTVPCVHHSEAKTRLPCLCLALLSDYIERIAGVPGDPARV